MGIKQELAHEFRWLLSQLPLKDLAAFSGNLATCIEAGLSVPDSVETCTRSSPNQLLRSFGRRIAEEVRRGVPLSEAMEGMAAHLPRFYLPVMRCGEQSGRTDEALRYLQEHCEMLERPHQVVRSLWLVPLVLYAVASAILIAFFFLLAPFLTAVRYLVHKVVRIAVLGAVVLLVINVPPLRRLWEHLLLALPIVGPAVQELAVNRFLHAFNLMYRTSGMTVPKMVHIACSAVGNTIIRDDFLQAAPRLERGDSLSESLTHCTSLTFDQRHTIAAGEEAGRIEDSLDRLCRQTSESLQTRLRAFGAIYFRVVGAIIVVGALLTLRSLLSLYFLL